MNLKLKGRWSDKKCPEAERTIYAWSGRIFEVFWRFVAFLVISTYTGGFVADLTSSRIKVPFENLAELVSAATNGDYKICVAKNTAFTTAVMVLYTVIMKIHDEHL